jgi:hypothetical protein
MMSNNLQQSKDILEKKIALSKSLIARKKKDFDYHTEQANEAQLIIEGLVCEQWKDQAALDAVNEEINNIPTIDPIEKSNPVWKEIVNPELLNQ